MKKIFAIALALVMVLSMASAFAANDCSTFDWTCSTKATACGKAKVEVVPYVMVNDGCGKFKYEVSTCATAINTQDVFYAVKLTVDANPDKDWFDAAKLTIKETEVTTTGITLTWPMGFFADEAFNTNYKQSEEQVWYLMKDTANVWKNASDEDFDIQKAVWAAEVGDARKAKVCAKLESEHSGLKDSWKVGDYSVKVVATGTDYKEGEITITKDNNEFAMEWEDGKVIAMGAKPTSFLAEVVSKFNMTGCVVGTCVDKDIIQRNFGWKDKVESCFSWSDKGASVVNPECVVTLPKTGDASLLWWLF